MGNLVTLLLLVKKHNISLQISQGSNKMVKTTNVLSQKKLHKEKHECACIPSIN